jgi:membrane protein implicated in regulation of membrane protease activity
MSKIFFSRLIGISSFVVALSSIFLSIVSGVGVYIAIILILLGSISLLMKEKVYALSSVIISTVSIFIVSPLPSLGRWPASMLFIILVPYSIFLMTLSSRFIHIKKTEKQEHDSGSNT